LRPRSHSRARLATRISVKQMPAAKSWPAAKLARPAADVAASRSKPAGGDLMALQLPGSCGGCLL